MAILVTGSAGHLGEALMRTLAAEQRDAIGIDILASPFTTHVGSIVERAFVRRHMAGRARCCTPRPCTSRMSRPIAGRISST